MLDDLDAIRADIADRLTTAASNWRVPMHSPVIATADADARVMVLRAFDAESYTLRFHTDVRAPKAALIGDGAPLGLLFYDPPEKVQIRCRGNGRIVREGPEVDAAWMQSTNFARRCYLGEGPGAVSDTPTSGLPLEFEGIEPSDEELLPARANFAVLQVELRHLDWFSLAHTGHRRAIFQRSAGGWQGCWVSP